MAHARVLKHLRVLKKVENHGALPGNGTYLPLLTRRRVTRAGPNAEAARRGAETVCEPAGRKRVPGCAGAQPSRFLAYTHRNVVREGWHAFQTRGFTIDGRRHGALLGVADALAHHSFAPHFDASKPVSISGTVTEFEARNPHSYLHIAAVDENGKTREYVCESHGVTQLTRNGITPQMLKAGTKVRVTGSLSRHSPYMCFFDSVEFADGRTLSVNGPDGTARAAPALRDAQGHLRHLAARADRRTAARAARSR